MVLNSAEIFLDLSEFYLNLRNHMIKFWNSLIGLKFRQIFVEFMLISEIKYIFEPEM